MRSTLASWSPAPRVLSVDNRIRRRRGIPAAEPENDAPKSTSSTSSQPQHPPPPSPSSSPPPPPPPITSPTDLVTWGGRLPSRRRLLISGAASASIVLAGNFGGATSLLLSSTDAAAAFARSLRLDVLFPVRGFKRALAPDGGGYEFVYPRAWLADQTVARRRAVAAELARPPLLDGGPVEPSAASAAARRRRALSSRAAPPGPEVAFGPAGSSGETNVSVIVAPIEPGFSMRQLGTPEEAGREFLETTVAKPGSGRTAELLRAEERFDDDGVLYYELEYRVTGPQFDRLNCSAFAGREGSSGAGTSPPEGPPGPRRSSAAVGPELVTLNAQAPWEDTQRDPGLARALRESARSLRVGKRAPGVSFGAGARPF